MNEANTTSTDSKLKAQTYACTAIPFDLGKMVYTQGIASILENNLGVSLMIYLQRHQHGDWRNVYIEDKITNDEITSTGERVLSEYQLYRERIWIITECDRSYTSTLTNPLIISLQNNE